MPLKDDTVKPPSPIRRNKAKTGAIAAAGSEAIIPVVSQWLYGTKDPEQLTADQKDTLSSIVSLVGAGTGALVGDGMSDVVSGSGAGQNAVDNNFDLIAAISPASAAMLSKDKQHREAMKMVAGIREGNIKITVAIYGGTAVVVGGGAIAAEVLPALASACAANPVSCTTIGVDSADTLAGLATGVVTVGSLAPSQVVSKGRRRFHN